ncbi:casein kinase 1-like isoform X2 [Iris pallida]|uniref:Casein kinase 1-like isoform X2 n=1 Tax=Iris pallida TaxID=29817 RepID=A0AAX6GJ84_IRIPA|nr:casein kinase 1-like isoform X2 [Iris pallida]
MFRAERKWQSSWENKNPIGTTRYASVNTHLGVAKQEGRSGISWICAHLFSKRKLSLARPKSWHKEAEI